jgi:hypothetical protein
MPPSSVQELAVLQSVVYAALFDYPLTLSQLRNSLVGVAADERTILAWWRQSALLQATVEHRNGLFFPAGRGDMIEIRARREGISEAQLRRDRRMLAVVSRMPFVRMAALSGSLAHLNSEDEADVDLFVITRAGRVWLVTVAVLVIAKLAGWRRRLCLNYVISERQMAVTPTDLFTANQIIHLRPLAGHGTFRRFLETNPFVAEWYPNFSPQPGAGSPSTSLRTSRESGAGLLERLLSLGFAQAAERVCRAAYRWHLRRQSAWWHSRDQVRLDDECLKLHTTSHRASTLARFDAAMVAATGAKSARAGALPALAARA